MNFSKDEIAFLFNLSNNYILRLNNNFKIVEFNKPWEERFFNSPTSKKSFFEFCHPKDQEKCKSVLKAVMQEKKTNTFYLRFCTESGETRFISWKIGFQQNEFFVIGTDKTEGELQKRYFSEIQEAAKIGYWRLDLKTQNPIWSKKTYDIHGVEVGTPVDLGKALDFFTPTSRAVVEAKVQDAIGKGISYDEELEFINARGENLWVRAVGKPVIVDDEVIELYGVFQDITERKLAKIQLEYVYEMAGDGFWDWHIKDDYEYMSPRFWDILGFSPSEKKHHPSEWQELMFEEDLKISLDNFEKHVATKGAHPFWQEVRYRHKDGSTVWVVCKGKVIEWDENNQAVRMIGTHTDITSLKKAQVRLTETAKLSALGEMAGGIAHEINNPLAIIATNSVLMKLLLENPEKTDNKKLLESVNTIERTVKRISKIVDGMRQLLRNQGKKVFKEHSTHEVIDKSLALCTEKIKSKCIELKVNTAEDTLIYCNLTQITQVLINLISNSIDAIEDSSTPWLQIETRTGRNSTQIVVTDSGPGIPLKHQKKLFEPFYSTKDVTKGTGLGLSISREILENHGGTLFLNVDCPNTSFIIELPNNALSK